MLMSRTTPTALLHGILNLLGTLSSTSGKEDPLR